MVIIDNYAQAVELPSNLLGKFNPLFNPFLVGCPTPVNVQISRLCWGHS